ncbi:GNAT family N-acetyltransferase [Aliiglaciecola sp. LCG003]|uniref:GNAT family N-acetyltransferase n=1 Tax=Aliiglaciecola sp. LCG003 TaxID=3053655 RepID=UPI0025731955|nr:GNAT family N-acetyltransferase [Aliiglaciecola sp. LCG003]WJG09012.1 GNAT family N-acetyltransferase [Aliiglaciecola sp. LCG003]
MSQVNIILSTERTIVRRIALSDAEFILRLVNDPSWLKHIGDRQVHSLNDAETFIQQGPLDSYQKNDFGLYVYADRTSLLPMGLCGLLQRDYLSAPDIGYATLAEYRGQGLTFEAVQAVLDYEVKKAQLPYVYAMVSAHNPSSISLLKKLAMQPQGEFSHDGKESLLFRLAI